MSKILVRLIIILVIICGIVGGVWLINYRLNNPPSRAVLEKEKTLSVKYTSEKINLDPFSSLWNRVNFTKIHLYPQSARIPYGSEERELFVKAIYNQEEIAFLLEFEDSTENKGLPANPDACAILFIPKDSPASAQMMGYSSQANVWHWLADRNHQKYTLQKSINVVRELFARGPGTQTPMEVQNVEGKGIYKQGRWFIVFKRKLRSLYKDEFNFLPGYHYRVAFAVWDGERMESFANKSISILRKLILEIK